MKKAILKISEGLGNQLFMYANAYAFSKKLNYKLFIDIFQLIKNLKLYPFYLTILTLILIMLTIMKFRIVF